MPSPHRRSAWRALCLGAALLGALPAAAWAQRAGAGADVEIRTRRLAEVAVHPEREASASVLARNETRLAAEVAGRLQRWHADVGQRVARGALLAEIDDSDHRLARQRARAALDASLARHALAQAQWRRAQELVAQGFLSPEAALQRQTEVDLQASEIAAARAQLAAAELQLARTRVVAPFAASVTQRLAQAGEYVVPGAPLFVLVERTGAEVSAGVAAADVDSLRAAGQWWFDGGGAAHALTLLRVAPTVTAPARTVEARFAFAAAQGAAPAGSQGRLRWRDPRAHVPASLVVRRTVDGASRLGVFVVEAGRARFVELAQAQEGRAAAAPPGLGGDAAVVVSGQATLSHGQAVALR